MSFLAQGKTNWKYIIVVMILAVIFEVVYLWYITKPEEPYQPVEIQKTEKKSTQEQGCFDSGGTVSMSSCCESTGDFPNSCLSGACGCSPNNSCQVKICNCGDGKCFDGEKCSPIEIPKTSLIQESFSSPYPLSWTWKEDRRKADFSLTAVSLGERTIPSFVYSPAHEPGDEINALTLYFKINTHWENVGVCVSTNLRMILNEEGDVLAPINNRFNAGCPSGDRTYFDQEVIFVVPETEKAFTLTTGRESNVFFTVTLLESGHLKVEKSYTEEQG